MRQIEIFRAGTHTSSGGQSLTFGDGELAAIAGGYNTALHHAPVVIGHPRNDDPAFGWVDALSVDNGRLVAQIGDVEPAFAEAVKAKRYRKVSAALYSPGSANNPTPGAYYLRHVGFLGAAAPAVKGLKPIEFAAGDDQVIFEIEFADPSERSMRIGWGFEAVAKLFRNLRDQTIARDGLETADAIIPDYEIESLNRTATMVRTADGPALFAEPTPAAKDPPMTEATKTAAAAAEDLARRQTELATREAAFADLQAKAAAAEDAAFVDAQVSAGRLPAGLRTAAVAIFGGLASDEITFSDAGGEKKLAPRAALRALLASLPVPVATGEIAKGDGPDFSDATAVASAIATTIADAKTRGEVISPAEAAERLKPKG